MEATTEVSQDMSESIAAIIPGANVQRTKRGWQIGGLSHFQMIEARDVLTAAGFDVANVWGATMVTGRTNG
jgi:hypothetical protein